MNSKVVATFAGGMLARSVGRLTQELPIRQLLEFGRRPGVSPLLGVVDELDQSSLVLADEDLCGSGAVVLNVTQERCLRVQVLRQDEGHEIKLLE